jgi:hypothetical protein
MDATQRQLIEGDVAKLQAALDIEEAGPHVNRRVVLLAALRRKRDALLCTLFGDAEEAEADAAEADAAAAVEAGAAIA